MLAGFLVLGLPRHGWAQESTTATPPATNSSAATPSAEAQPKQNETLPPVTVVEEQARQPRSVKQAKGLVPATKGLAPATPTSAPTPMFEWSTTDTGTEPGANAQQKALDLHMQAMDQSRENLLTKIGASSYSFTREAIETLPQGDNTEIDKIVLQAPGVNYDSAASNPDYHIRGEYANVQYRINGIVLPEGVSGLGPVIDAGFIGRLSLLTGTLPAEYGLRTAGVLDITSRAFSVPGGTVTMYGGSRETSTPSFDYGGSEGNTQYFVAAHGNWNALGIENPTPSIKAIHDFTDQGKFFGYVSTLLNESTRLSIISGASYSTFQIPNNADQTPLGDFGPATYSSANLNENEYDTFVYNMAALQTKSEALDTQLAIYMRYADVHFVPDIFGDLVFNDVAANVTRQSNLYGTQFDAAYRLNPEHTLRAGFIVNAERTNVINTSTVLPVDPVTDAILPTPFAVTDATSLLGWTIGTYVQDEWKLSNTVTLNVGVRFDQLYQFVELEPSEPARNSHLQALRWHEHSCRLRAVFYAAVSGPSDPIEPRLVHQHDQPTGNSTR